MKGVDGLSKTIFVSIWVKLFISLWTFSTSFQNAFKAIIEIGEFSTCSVLSSVKIGSLYLTWSGLPTNPVIIETNLDKYNGLL